MKPYTGPPTDLEREVYAVILQPLLDELLLRFAPIPIKRNDPVPPYGVRRWRDTKP